MPRSTIPIEDYTIFSVPGRPAIDTWNAWYEGLDSPYVIEHFLSRGKGIWTCDCPHFRIRLFGTGVHCKHIKEVQRRLGARIGVAK